MAAREFIYSAPRGRKTREMTRARAAAGKGAPHIPEEIFTCTAGYNVQGTCAVALVVFTIHASRRVVEVIVLSVQVLAKPRVLACGPGSGVLVRRTMGRGVRPWRAKLVAAA